MRIFCILILLSTPMGLFADAPSHPIQPIPLRVKLNQEKVKLGELLFHDKQLSKDNTVSCASCHSLDKGGVDNLPLSKGVNGALGTHNSPTVFNSQFNFRQFWDGRAKTLEEQIDGPITHPKEMASNWKDIIQKLKKDKKYSSLFPQIYSDGINENNIKDAIATFERSLITPNSRFDKFLRGDLKAISEREKKGYNLFKSYGCISCHQGMNVGGNMFQKFGAVEKFPGLEDQLFKVPSLRNVELTAPYFHDGSAKDLKTAIKTMARFQLGRVIDDKDTQLIIDFLKTLTGEYKGTPLNEIK